MQADFSFPKGWKLAAIQDLAMPQPNAVVDGPFGSNLKTSDYVDKGIPVLQGGNITGNRVSLNGLRFVTKQKAHELRRSLVKVGDLLVVKIGSIGYAAIIDNLGDFDFALIPANLLKSTFDNVKTDTRFILHYLTSEFGARDLNDLTGRTAQPAISLSKFKDLQIPAPPLSEQHRIAEILDTIDEAIQKTEALISKLKAMKQGLLHDLLTRGLDETGKLRDPKTHPEQFKDSPLGGIPKEWEPVHLLDLISIPNGQVDPKQKPYCYWPLIAPDHIESDTGRLLCLKTAIEQGAISGKYAFKPGDVLYSKIRPYLRKAVIADRQGLCSADMYPLQSGPSLVPRFLLDVILGEHFSRFATSVSERSGFPKINRKELGEYRLALPPRDEQLKIASIMDSHDTRIRTEEQYRDKLKLQKKGLMHDLLTGKVRVKV